MLAGLLVFIVVEKLFSLSDDYKSNEIIDKKNSVHINSANNNHKDSGKLTKCNNGATVKESSHIQVNYKYNYNFY